MKAGSRVRRLVILSLIGLLTYIFRRRIVAWLLHLPQPTQHRICKETHHVTMRDGVTLATSIFHSSTPSPAILIRTPYGRNASSSAAGWTMAQTAYLFAERGYSVVLQDVRGRFDSGGIFNPYFHEKDDALDTIAWLKTQPWFNGELGMWGPSYLGIVQWAVAAHAPEIRAIVPIVTGSDLHSILYPDGVFDLGLAMRWMSIFEALDNGRKHPFLAAPTLFRRMERTAAPAFTRLPLAHADNHALGTPIEYYQMWLEHPDVGDSLWQEIITGIDIQNVRVPAHLIGGWYDFFLRALLADYKTLQAAGRNPYLTIGPWHHFNGMLGTDALRQSIEWLDAHLKHQRAGLRKKPVRLYVMGAEEWREMDTWPPPTEERRYYLGSGRTLQPQPSSEAHAVSTYRYDPLNPTTIVGGTQFNPLAGPKDNRQLEAREDVLTFTTPVLENDVEVIGPVWLELFVKSSLEHTDFFGRLCDVHPDGRSINICDGLFRIQPGKGERLPDGSRRIEVDMWATAHRFRRGHRIRLQVSSGAHPRWTRNLGTGEPFATATNALCADQTIYHDREHPSALVLPVTNV
jgi:putative CocE/NonD family hydrolase